MNKNDLQNHVFLNVKKNRTLIILGDDGEKLDIFSSTANVYPHENIGRGKYSKAELLKKLEEKELEFVRIGDYVIPNFNQ